MIDDESRVVPLVRAVRTFGYADDVKERCYAIWSTAAAMNAEATVARYAREVEEGTPIPTPQTVNSWVRGDGWHARIVADFKCDHGERLFWMQLRKLVQLEASDEEMSKVLAGVYDDQPMVAAIRVKAREQVTREAERLPVFRAIVPQVPQQVQDDFSKLTLAEREAAMKAAVQAKKGKAHG